MPISANVNKSVMVAPLMSDEEWDVLCTMHEKGSVSVTTRCCNMPAAPAQTKYGSRFFRAPACKHCPEDNHTVNIQSLLAKALRDAGWSVSGSLPETGSSGKNRMRVDVLGTSPDVTRKIGFVVYPGEPGGEGSLSIMMSNVARAREAGIDLVSLFPSLPAGGVWAFLRQGKILPTATYMRNPLMIAGLPPHEYLSLVMKKPPVTHKRGLKPAVKICTYAYPVDGKQDVVCGFQIFYNDDEIWAGEWTSGWSHLEYIDTNRTVGGKKKAYAESTRNEIKQQNLLVTDPLLCAEMIALRTALSHVFISDGKLYQFKEITPHLILAPSRNPDMRDIVADIISGGVGRRYATEYPRFFYLAKKMVQDMKRSKTFVVAMSSTPTEPPQRGADDPVPGMVFSAEIIAIASGPNPDQEVNLVTLPP